MPSVLVCDAANAILNGFQEVFGADCTFVMCYAHMYRTVTKKLATFIKCKKVSANILADIIFLQIISNG